MKNITPLRAIRQKCLDCSGGSWSEVKNCQIIKCPLFTLRFGKNPKRSSMGVAKNLTTWRNRVLSGRVLAKKGIVEVG
jgi:hypothetical protein